MPRNHLESFSQWFHRRLNDRRRKREKSEKETHSDKGWKERWRKDEENAFFIPMTRLPVACWIFVALQSQRFRRIEKERKTKRWRKGTRKSQRESPPRVLFRIRAEPASAFLFLSLLFLRFSPFFLFSSPLLDESARRLITQHYPQASATPAFLHPVLLHPLYLPPSLFHPPA